MALVYEISVIMKEYTISYRDGRYRVNRSWYFFYLVQLPSNVQVTNYHTPTCIDTIVSSSGSS